MPTARNHAAIGVVNGKIYVIGGRVGSVFVVASNTDMVEEYDPATDSWGFTRARMPTPRSGVGFATYGGRIYVAGGEYLDNQMVGVFRDLEAYDPTMNQWFTLPPLSTPRHGLVGGIIGNRLHMISGHLQSGNIGGSPADSNANEAFELP